MFTNAKEKKEAKREMKPVGMLLLAGQDMEMGKEHLGERMEPLDVEQVGVGKEHEVVQKTQTHFQYF